MIKNSITPNGPANIMMAADRSARWAGFTKIGLCFITLFALLLTLVSGRAAAQAMPGTADLAAAITPGETIIDVGDEVTFTSTFTNNGPATASNVRMVAQSPFSRADNYAYLSVGASTGNVVEESPFYNTREDVVYLPALASGESVTMTVIVRVLQINKYEDAHVFTALISSDQAGSSDPDPNNNIGHSFIRADNSDTTTWDSHSVAYRMIPGYDPYYISYTGGSGAWYVNQDVLFELTIKNDGPAEATSVTMQNKLCNADNAYSGPVYDIDTNRLEGLVPASGATNLRAEVLTQGLVTGIEPDGINYTIQSMAAGSSVTIRLTYTITEPQRLLMESVTNFPPEITNKPEKVRYSGVTISDSEMPGIADISVSTTADRTAVPFGENTVVRVAVTNNGPAPAYDVQSYIQGAMFNFMVDYISTDSTAGSVENYQTASFVDSGKSFTVPVLNPGQTETMTLVFRKKSFEAIQTWSGANYDVARSIDPNRENNTTQRLTLTTIGEPPVFDVQASITASAAMAQPGGLLVYNMSVTNAGPDDVPSTITLSTNWVKFILPEWGPNGITGHITVEDGDVEFRSIQDSGQWSLKIEDQGLMASLPYLAAGETANLVLVYNVSPNAMGDDQGNINNSIYVSIDYVGDANTSNNTATVSTPINTTGGSGADLLVTQTGTAQAAVLNQPVSYTVTARNMGPNPTNAAYLGYLVPGAASLTSITSDKGTPVVVNNYASVSDVPLAVGEAVTMTVNVTPNQVGQLASYSAGTSNVFDPDIANNYSEQSTLVVEAPPVDEPPVVVPPVIVPPVDIPCSKPVDLSAQILKVRKKGKIKKKTGEWKFQVRAKVGVTNLGTECAPHTVVKLYLSDDMIIDASDQLLGVKIMKPNCPGKNGKTKVKKVNFKMKLEPGVNPIGRYLIAVADGDNIVPECNEINNNATAF